MPPLDTAFWHEEFGFIFDPTHHPVALTPEMKAFHDGRIAEALESSGMLPDLGAAPVASWLLPRLAELTHDGIHLDDGERLRNDGGGVQLRWLAFTKSIQPRAFFHVRCRPGRISVVGDCMPNTEPAQLVNALLAALLETPAAIRKLRVSVIDTDPPNAPGKLGRTYLYGWDGSRFLGNREYP